MIYPSLFTRDFIISITPIFSTKRPVKDGTQITDSVLKKLVNSKQRVSGKENSEELNISIQEVLGSIISLKRRGKVEANYIEGNCYYYVL